jgi:four helix bundle protein
MVFHEWFFTNGSSQMVLHEWFFTNRSSRMVLHGWFWHRPCSAIRMAGVRRVEDLICWQLASELKYEILAVTRGAPWGSEPDLRRQIRKSCRSSSALIAEGFGRFRPKDNARFVEMAVASLMETRDHLRDAAHSELLPIDRFVALWRLSQRALTATSRYHRCLRNCKSVPAKNAP